MEIKVERKWKKEKYTVGRMMVNGEFFCNTLEDVVREIDVNGVGKIKGETAIPAGEYKVIVNYSPKFGRQMPRLLNVPFFDGILIHSGNTAKDSAGCILVGYNKKAGELCNSRDVSDRLTEMVEAAQRRGEDIWIVIE